VKNEVYRVIAWVGEYSDYLELTIGIFDSLFKAEVAVYNLAEGNHKALLYLGKESTDYSTPEDATIEIQKFELNKEYSFSKVLNLIHDVDSSVETYSLTTVDSNLVPVLVQPEAENGLSAEEIMASDRFEFAKRLVLLRVSHQLTQVKAAEICGIPSRFYSMMESCYVEIPTNMYSGAVEKLKQAETSCK